MLFDDQDSSATVLTTMPPDDIIVETLLSKQFKRGRGEFLQNFDKKYEKYDYWYSSLNGKTIIIGFRDPAVAPIPEDRGLCM